MRTGVPAAPPRTNAQSQLVVSGKYAGGQERDLTRTVKFTSNPTGIISIDGTGLVVPLADGKATVTATEAGGKTATVTIAVEHYKNTPSINFPNQIMPLFTKFGCNGGGCHGKASGQNGFKLSLLGFEPTEDFEHLVKEGRGRRLSPGAPDTSLLLTKAINAVPHGGGERLELIRWNTACCVVGFCKACRTATRRIRSSRGLKSSPTHRTMAPGGEQQLVVTAFYSDGSPPTSPGWRSSTAMRPIWPT
ncbi:MAG: Ig-like domain-containing protein [Pirellulales bacterium]